MGLIRQHRERSARRVGLGWVSASARLERLMAITISDAVQKLLAIVAELHETYPVKPFTLDGRLLGDIGEVLVWESYDLELFPGLPARHDAKCSRGRLVQIKATMKDSLTFPADHVPDYYLGIQIHSNGAFTEIFNGPGSIAWEAIKGRKGHNVRLHSVKITALQKLQLGVSAVDIIPRRVTPS